MQGNDNHKNCEVGWLLLTVLKVLQNGSDREAVCQIKASFVKALRTLSSLDTHKADCAEK